ncbi:MAG: flagellar export chaperone FlgN [Pseudomonadota bacterium]
METLASTLAFLFEEKLLMYHELIEVLKTERKWIVTAKTEQLWQESDKKQRIVSTIEALRERILETLSAQGVFHDMTVTSFRPSRVMTLVPIETRKSLVHLQSALNLAKEEIQERSRENVAFVEDYLATLDDLIGIFMQKKDGGAFYDRHRHVEHNRTRSLLHQEV